MIPPNIKSEEKVNEKKEGVCKKILRAIHRLVRAIKNLFLYCFFSLCYLGLCIGICGGFFFIFILFLAPLNYERSYVNSITDLKLFQIEAVNSHFISISDSNSCSHYDYGACVEKVCSFSLASVIDFNCKYYLKISKPILFEKFVINCKTNEQCEIQINSELFSSNQLFLFGYDINVNANKIQTRNLFFDSYEGSLKVEKLIFEKATANTSFGDIIIQTTDNVELTTKTNKKYVCVTCSQGWLDNLTPIKNIESAFKEMDAKNNECLQVYPYHSRRHQNMISSGLHSVLEQQNQSKQIDKIEQRCSFIDKVILMSNQNNPSTVPNLKQIIAGNQEGNVHINVMQDNNILQPKLINTEYETSELSPSSQSSLKDTVTSISDSGKNNEIIYLDFRQSSDFIENFLYVMLFSPIYLHLSPAWLSALSFHSLSNKEQSIQLALKPGFCPYIFTYSQIESNEEKEEIVQIREIEIKKVIDEYLVKENLNVYFTSSWKDYSSFNLRDEATYLDIDGIRSDIKIIASTEIICIIILLVTICITYQKILNKLYSFLERNEEQDFQKLLFFFYQNQFSKLSIQQDECNESPLSSQQSPLLKCSSIKQNEAIDSDMDQILERQTSKNKTKVIQVCSGSINKDKDNKINKIEDEEICNLKKKIKLSCSYHIQDRDIHCQFQTLSTQAFSWLLQRYNNSLKIFFLKIIKIKYPRQDEKKNKIVRTQINVSELKEYYQKFCYMYNLQEEPLFVNKPDFYEFMYDQTIVFKKFEKSYLKNGQTLVSLSRPQKQQIQDFIEQNNQFTGSMSLSQFYYIMSRANILSKNHQNNKIEEAERPKESDQINPNIDIQLVETNNKQVQEKEKDDKKDNSQTKFDQINIFNQSEKNEQNKQSDNKNLNENDQVIQKQQQPQQQEQQQDKNKVKKQVKNISYFDFYESQQIDSDEDESENNEIDEEEEAKKSQQNQEEDEEDQFSFYIYATNQKVFAYPPQCNERKDELSFFTRGNALKIIDNSFLKFIDVNFDSFLVGNKENRQILKQIYKSRDIKIPKYYPNIIKRRYPNIKYDEDEIYQMYKKELQQRFYYVIINTKTIQNNENYILNILLSLIAFVLIQILYLLSPFIAVFILLAFVFIYLNQYHKFSVDSITIDDSDIAKKAVVFSDVGVSLLFYSCVLFIIFFYFLIKSNYITSLSKRSQNRYIANFNIIDRYDKSQRQWRFINQTQSRFKRFFRCIYIFIYSRIFRCLLILQLVYLSVALLILVVGTIIFPSVQLPTLIFFGFLLGVIVNSIINFRDAYQAGSENLKQNFEARFLESCAKLKEGKNNVEEVSEAIQQKGTLAKIEEELQPNQGKPKCEYPKQYTKIIGVKDLKTFQKSKYEDIFSSIEGCLDKELSEKEFKNFLKSINMSINQVQLDQLYSYLNTKEIVQSRGEIKLWRMHKRMGIKQFEMAIDYIINQKVKFTLNILDVSYSSLCLSTIKTILYSVIIAWVIYSVFVCFSSSSTSFDFNSNSLVSLGGVLGIIFSKEDKGKIFEDKDLIESTVEITETEMHSYL